MQKFGYRCAAILIGGLTPSTVYFASPVNEDPRRCRWVDESGETLDEHHVDYKRGLRVPLCRPHHHYVESQIRWYKRRSS